MKVCELSGVIYGTSAVIVDLRPRCQVCHGPLTFRVITRDKGNGNRFRNYECEYCGEWHYFYHDNPESDSEGHKFTDW